MSNASHLFKGTRGAPGIGPFDTNISLLGNSKI